METGCYVRPVRRRVLLSLVVAVCGLAGAWAAPRVAGPATYPTDVATLRFQLALSSPAERGLNVFVPLANWGLRAAVIGAPVKLSVEPRAIDREGVVRRLALRTALLLLAGALAGGLLAGLAWHVLGVRGRALLVAPAASLGLVVVIAGALAGWATATWKPERLERPTYFASGVELQRILEQAGALRRSGEKYSDQVNTSIRSIAGLLNDPSTGGSGKDALGDSSSASLDSERVILGSDIHNNLLTLPTVRRYSKGHLTILDGDFTVNGGKAEAPLLSAWPRSATRPWRSRATTTRPASCRRSSARALSCSATTTASGRSPA